MSRKAIARQLRINIKTLRAILRGSDVFVRKARNDSVRISEDVLGTLYKDCDGYVQRMYEILNEDHGISVGYSTLTRLVRKHGLGPTPKQRACRVPDVPGEEMQHDTSVHKVAIAGEKRKVISCGLYLRYSKMRYVRFYRRFNRFTMKCFIHEALRHWGYTARYCIIDNTNLAVLNGTGAHAVMNPEAASFADNYGFTWKAHELKHANRKAGKERNFYTIETNFFPGRRFASLEDLNAQAIQWATVRYAQRPQAKTKLIPIELFKAEKSALIKLPDYIHPPSFPHRRKIDEYGYCSFDGNFYWVPESAEGPRVAIIQYARHICIMQGLRTLAQYPIAPDGIKNQMFVPPDHPQKPQGPPRNRKQSCHKEEERLLALGAPLSEYLALLKTADYAAKRRPRFIRALFSLSRQLGPTLFRSVMRRALAYKVFDKAAIERMAAQMAAADAGFVINIDPISDDYRGRQSYQQGQYTEENDIDLNECC